MRRASRGSTAAPRSSALSHSPLLPPLGRQLVLGNAAIAQADIDELPEKVEMSNAHNALVRVARRATRKIASFCSQTSPQSATRHGHSVSASPGAGVSTATRRRRAHPAHCLSVCRRFAPPTTRTLGAGGAVHGTNSGTGNTRRGGNLKPRVPGGAGRSREEESGRRIAGGGSAVCCT